MSEQMLSVLLWGLVASAAMVAVLQGSQGLRLSRLNLPFLIGSMFSGRRRRAVIVGMTVYLIGGWVFAVL
jgi:hypothetical protein